MPIRRPRRALLCAQAPGNPPPPPPRLRPHPPPERSPAPTPVPPRRDPRHHLRRLLVHLVLILSEIRLPHSFQSHRKRMAYRAKLDRRHPTPNPLTKRTPQVPLLTSRYSHYPSLIPPSKSYLPPSKSYLPPGVPGCYLQSTADNRNKTPYSYPIPLTPYPYPTWKPSSAAENPSASTSPGPPPPAPHPAIVLLHGSGGGVSFWLDRIGPMLSRLGVLIYAVHYFDRTGTDPGHARHAYRRPPRPALAFHRPRRRRPHPYSARRRLPPHRAGRRLARSLSLPRPRLRTQARHSRHRRHLRWPRAPPTTRRPPPASHPPSSSTAKPTPSFPSPSPTLSRPAHRPPHPAPAAPPARRRPLVFRSPPSCASLARSPLSLAANSARASNPPSPALSCFRPTREKRPLARRSDPCPSCSFSSLWPPV